MTAVPGITVPGRTAGQGAWRPTAPGSGRPGPLAIPGGALSPGTGHDKGAFLAPSGSLPYAWANLQGEHLTVPSLEDERRMRFIKARLLAIAAVAATATALALGGVANASAVAGTEYTN